MPRRQRFKPSRKPKPAIDPSDAETTPSDSPPPREDVRPLPAQSEERR